MWSSRSSAASSPRRVEAVAHCHRPVLTKHPFWEVITFTWLTGTLHTLFIVVTFAIHPFGKAMSTPFILLKHTKVHNVVYNSAVIQRKHYCQRLSDQTRLGVIYKFVISLSVEQSAWPCRLWQEYYGLAERSDLIWHCKIWRKYSENTSLKENWGIVSVWINGVHIWLSSDHLGISVIWPILVGRLHPKWYNRLVWSPQSL